MTHKGAINVFCIFLLISYMSYQRLCLRGERCFIFYYNHQMGFYNHLASPNIILDA